MAKAPVTTYGAVNKDRRLFTTGKVVRASKRFADVELPDGNVIGHVPLSGAAEKGQTVDVVYEHGRPKVYGPGGGISGGGSSGGAVAGAVVQWGAPSPHALNSSTYHSGQLAPSQATWALNADGSVTLTGNMAVTAGVQIDGVDISAFKTAYDAFVAGIAETAQDAVGGILTDSASIDFTYNDGAGTITAAVIQAGIDHGSITGLGDDDHTQYLNTTRHDTTARHGATVVDHGSIGGLSDDDHSIYYTTARGDARWLQLGGGTLTGALHMTAADLTGTLSSSPFTAGATGWQVLVSGSAEMKSLTLREALHVSTFTLDLMQAQAGTMVLALAASALTSDAVVPGSGTWSMSVRQMPGALDPFTADGQIGYIKALVAGTVRELWFTVTGRSTTGGVQTFTATYQGGTRGITYPSDTPVVNYGSAGQGVLFLTADQSNAPFYDVRTHAGAPWTTQTVNLRLGNLAGITDASFGGALSGYGLYAQNTYLAGTLVAGGGNVVLGTPGLKIKQPGILGEFYHNAVLYGALKLVGTTSPVVRFDRRLSGAELITNPAFDANTTGWTTELGGGSIAQDTTTKRTGAGSLSVSVNNGASIRAITSSGYAATVGASYAFRGWIRPVTTTNLTINVQVRFYDSGGTLISGASVAPLLTVGEWVYFETRATAPATTVTVKPAVLATSSGASGVVLNVDDLALTIESEYSGIDLTSSSIEIEANTVVNLRPKLSVAGEIVASTKVSASLDGNTGGLFIGTDGQIYRDSADVLRTPDALTVDGVLSTASDLKITGAAKRIIADFSHGTQSQRVAFQSSTANAGTNVPIIPNGTSLISAITCFNSSSVANCSQIQLTSESGGTKMILRSGGIGSGASLPLVVEVGTGVEIIRFNPNDMTFAEAKDIIFGATTGTKIGMAADQKCAFHGATPVIQRANAAQAAAPAGGTGATAGAYDTAAHRDSLIALVNEMRTVLVEKGLMKGSA